MADFSLQDMWWNKPPRTESQLPALQLGVQIVQRRAQEDMQERQLANEFARTEIARSESLAKMQLQNSISAANAGLAQLASQIKDWSDPVQMKPIYDWGALNGSAVGTKGWEGIINTHERAVTAKRLGENTQSLIDSRKERADYNAKKLALSTLIADHTIPLTDARVINAQRELALEERQLLVSEGNLAVRKQETDQKENRLGLREQYLNERNALNNEEKAKLARVQTDPVETDRLRKLYNLKRREVTRKFYGPNPTAASRPAAASPKADSPDHMPAFPAVPARKEDLKKDETYISTMGPVLWDGEQFIEQ